MMTKSDLKPFYVVKTRNGSLHLVGQDAKGLCVVSERVYISMNEYDEDMNALMPEFDIVEIYGYSKCWTECKDASTNQRELLWQRLEGSTKKLLKALGGLKVETGSLSCLGCKNENQCSTKGCAIIREACDIIGQRARAEELIRKTVNKEAKIHQLSAEEVPKYTIF